MADTVGPAHGRLQGRPVFHVSRVELDAERLQLADERMFSQRVRPVQRRDRMRCRKRVFDEVAAHEAGRAGYGDEQARSSPESGSSRLANSLREITSASSS